MNSLTNDGLRSKIVIFGKYVLTIINIIAAIASIAGLVYTIQNDIPGQIFFFIAVGCICFISIVATMGVHLSVKNDRVALGMVYSECFHDLMHSIRNMIEEDDTIQLTKPYNSHYEYRRHITDQSIKLMTKLSQHLTSAFSINIRACIKLFNFIHPDEQELKVITFARNDIELNEMLEEQYHVILVNENTDFDYIFQHDQANSSEHPSFFFQKDLAKFAKDEIRQGRKYNNSTRDWKKKYRTTIVMPIRYLYTPANGDQPFYDLLGYLCVDSKNTKAFASGYTTFIIELLKGLADILYHYYDGCTYYYKELYKENTKNK